MYEDLELGSGKRVCEDLEVLYECMKGVEERRLQLLQVEDDEHGQRIVGHPKQHMPQELMYEYFLQLIWNLAFLFIGYPTNAEPGLRIRVHNIPVGTDPQTAIKVNTGTDPYGSGYRSTALVLIMSHCKSG